MAKVNEAALNTFNQNLRSNEGYRSFLQNDLGFTGPLFEAGFHLSDDQRKKAADWVRANYGGLPDAGRRMEIDSSGNVNQDEGFSKYATDWKTYAAIAAGLTGAGALGFGPLSGVLSSGAAAGSGASTAASGLVPNAGSALTAALSGSAPVISSGATSMASGGFLPFLGKLAGNKALGVAGDALGSISDKMSSNRGAQAALTLDAEERRQAGEKSLIEALIAKAVEQRAQAGDAWKRMQQADFVSNYKSSMPQVSPYQRSIQGPSASLKSAASDPNFIAELKKRAQFGYDPYEGTDVNNLRMPSSVNDQLNKLGKSSLLEKLTGGAGLGMRIMSSL